MSSDFYLLQFSLSDHYTLCHNCLPLQPHKLLSLSAIMIQQVTSIVNTLFV